MTLETLKGSEGGKGDNASLLSSLAELRPQELGLCPRICFVLCFEEQSAATIKAGKGREGKGALGTFQGPSEHTMASDLQRPH